MKWFEHRHYWRLKTAIDLTEKGCTKGVQMVEECGCGALRTIEIFPGKAPVVRMAEEERAGA